ncbi:MAG TPA: hypothetical protein VIJ94_00900 [Caulobacteraceae bacterium]
MSQPDLHTALPYLIGIIVLVVVMGLRLRRMNQTRPLKVEWLWVTPAILTVLTVLSLIPQPPQGIAWAWLAIALVIGGALGWWRGKMMHISVDPETHALNTKASPAAMIFIVALIAIRMALRGVAMGEASALHLSVTVITGAFMAFAIGLFGVQRLEMALRANRLLREARAARASANP